MRFTRQKYPIHFLCMTSQTCHKDIKTCMFMTSQTLFFDKTSNRSIFRHLISLFILGSNQIVEELETSEPK